MSEVGSEEQAAQQRDEPAPTNEEARGLLDRLDDYLVAHWTQIMLYAWAFFLGPLNVSIAWHYQSLHWLLYFYWVAFAGCMHALAAAILIAGLITPMFSLGWWIYSTLSETGPVQQ